MKKFGRFMLCLLTAFLFVGSVNAATGSIKATTGTRVATVGSTFDVTVTVQSTGKLGTWKFGISYDSSKLSLVSGDTLVVGYNDGKINKSTSYKYRFKAIKSGSASINVVNAEIADFDTVQYIATTTQGVTVTMKTQAEIQASYSKNNDLKSLSVDGYEISPGFDKNTLEYKVSVPETETQIKINASPADGKARVSGAGVIDISEGNNTVSIVVTAENGSTKTYTLNVDVRDLNPIEVEVENEKYTIVKKSDLLTESVGFVLNSVTIDGIEVPAYKNELAGLTLVGLKDSSGKISMYIYDESSKSYSKYVELRSSSITLLPIDIESTPKGFSKDNMVINGHDYEVMKSDYSDDYIVIYALNVETGEKGYYIFDEETNGLIVYNAAAYEKLISQNEEFKLFLFATGGAAFLMFLLCLALNSKISKLKKLIRKVSSKDNCDDVEKDTMEKKNEDNRSESDAKSSSPYDDKFSKKKK